MAQWVIDGLSQAETVEHLVVIGLEQDSGLHSPKPISYISDQGGLVDNLMAGTLKILEIAPQTQSALTAAADIPTLRGSMVDWLVGQAKSLHRDLIYPVIEKSIMEARFPGTQRSYLPMKDGDYCGGDLFVLGSGLLKSDVPRWEKILSNRKRGLVGAALMGLDLVILIALRRLTLLQAEKLASRRLGIQGCLLPCPFAEVGMDVDRPNQLEILRRDLEEIL